MGDVFCAWQWALGSPMGPSSLQVPTARLSLESHRVELTHTSQKSRAIFTAQGVLEPGRVGGSVNHWGFWEWRAQRMS